MDLHSKNNTFDQTYNDVISHYLYDLIVSECMKSEGRLPVCHSRVETVTILYAYETKQGTTKPCSKNSPYTVVPSIGRPLIFNIVII